MQQHYERMCKVVRTRAILSLGLACFRWDTRTTETTTCSRDEQGLKVTSDSCEVVRVCPSVEVEVFNIWLLCQEAYTIDPVSAKFLVAHGFDFNKQFSLGLPYTPPEARTKVGVVYYRMGVVLCWSRHGVVCTIYSYRQTT